MEANTTACIWYPNVENGWDSKDRLECDLRSSKLPDFRRFPRRTCGSNAQDRLFSHVYRICRLGIIRSI